MIGLSPTPHLTTLRANIAGKIVVSIFAFGIGHGIWKRIFAGVGEVALINPPR